MTKVTYLFGAGASANALPTVEKLSSRISTLIREINVKDMRLQEQEYFWAGTDRSGKSKLGHQNEMIEDMQWLADVSHPTKHASIDTFAKKLFLKGKKELLNRMKNALSVFFILEQARMPVEMRYDTFFASILNEDVSKFPEDIKILSWNYDYQFEKAFSAFSDKNDLGENQKLLNVVSKFSPEITPAGFTIIKINGTTGYGGKAHGKPIIHHFVKNFDLNSEFDLKLLESVVDRYQLLTHWYKNDVYSTLSFAWEGEGAEGETIIDKAISCTKDTEVLVVVGYSFPFFNREVDRKIIRVMTKLRKVYFQAPAPWHEKTKTRFQAIRQDIDPKNLVAYDEVESFLLPDELEL